VPNVELAIFGLFPAQGFTVIVPDTEGQRADFAAGAEYGMNTLDSIRAAFNASTVELANDANIALLGYSGGAIASEWDPELAPTYAPDVDARMIGAAIGGLLVHPAHNLHYVENTYFWAGVIPMALMGIARAFEADFAAYLTARGLRLYRDMQATSIVNVVGQPAYWQLKWSDLVIPAYPNPESLPLFVSLGNKPGIGAGDGVMITGDVRTLARTYCAQGTAVQYEQYDLLSHTTSVGIWLLNAIGWINDRFAGQPAPQNCASIPPGNPLDPIPVPSL